MKQYVFRIPVECVIEMSDSDVRRLNKVAIGVDDPDAARDIILHVEAVSPAAAYYKLEAALTGIIDSNTMTSSRKTST